MTAELHPKRCATCNRKYYREYPDGTQGMHCTKLDGIIDWNRAILIDAVGCYSYSDENSECDERLSFINKEWVKQYCDVEIESETERWEDLGRPKNEGYINGSHSGHTHALRDLKSLIERLERIELRRQQKG
jgi:hypothetical protein